DCLRRRPLYQPEISDNPCRSRIDPNTAASRGNLLPSSIPSNPARRASERQVSRGVSPPNSGISSLLQPIGLMPRRTGIDYGSPCSVARRAYSPERRIATAARRLLSFPQVRERGTPMAKAGRSIVVFDLGGVLIDWDPRHLYRKLFAGDEAAMEHFLATVCTHEWNRGQDAGRTFAEGARLLKTDHPDRAELIDAYCARFDEMVPGPIAGSVEILA